MPPLFGADHVAGFVVGVGDARRGQRLVHHRGRVAGAGPVAVEVVGVRLDLRAALVDARQLVGVVIRVGIRALGVVLVVTRLALS